MYRSPTSAGRLCTSAARRGQEAALRGRVSLAVSVSVFGTRVGATRAADAGLDALVEAGERPAADEQDVRRVDLDELLVGVLAAPLGRHRRRRPLQDLQQRLLHPFARHIPGDRRVLALAGDLVDL